jgi:hypothetical protein
MIDKEPLPPEIKELLGKNPTLAVMGMIILGVLLMKPSKPGVDVPGLKERRNGAWRGRGSFGHAPFGRQVGHRR